MDENFSRKNTELMNDSNQDSEIKGLWRRIQSLLLSLSKTGDSIWMPNIPGLQHLSKKILGLQ